MTDWSAHRVALTTILERLELPAVDLPATAPPGDPVGLAVARCGARAHRVDLRETMSGYPRTPLLAIHKVHGPVALLPAGRRWRCAQTDQKVAADDLEPTGWVVGRRLPYDGIAGRPLLGFAARGAAAHLAATTGFGLLNAVLSFATPFCSLLLIAAVLNNGNILLAAVALAGAIPLVWLATSMSDRASAALQTRLQATVEPAVWDRLLSLPLPFFRQHPLRRLLGYAGGIGRLRTLLGTTGLDAVLGAVFSGIAIALLAVVDLRLGLAAVGLAAVLLAVTGWLSWRQQAHDRAVYTGVENVQATLYPALLGVDEVHVYGAERLVFDRWQREFTAQKRADDAGLRYAEVSTALITAAVPAFLAVLLPLSYLSGAGLTGAWAVVLATVQLNLALSRLPAVLQAAFSFRTTHDQLLPILRSRPENQHGRIPGRLSGRIELRDVTFGYPGSAPVLTGITLSVRAGEFVAVVGESGAGKSTLLRLLLGLDRPATGEIRLDGQHLAELDVDMVRGQIGYVPQDGRVLRGDVRSAILGGLPNGDDATAWAAATLAGLAGDIRALPMGLDTRLTDGESGLSGGQLQRLLLARALAKEPRILLLDEATSALDSATQDAVAAAVTELGLTRVVVAHRLSTIRQADRIMVISGGRIAETGTFDQLLTSGGPFSRMALSPSGVIGS